MSQNCRICGSRETTYSGSSSIYGACNGCTRRAINELEEREDKRRNMVDRINTNGTARRRIDHMEARGSGVHLESVGTWLHHDGTTYPVNADDTVTMAAEGASLQDKWDHEGIRLVEIDPNGEGYDWYEALSVNDRDAVEQWLRAHSKMRSPLGAEST